MLHVTTSKLSSVVAHACEQALMSPGQSYGREETDRTIADFVFEWIAKEQRTNP